MIRSTATTISRKFQPDILLLPPVLQCSSRCPGPYDGIILCPAQPTINSHHDGRHGRFVIRHMFEAKFDILNTVLERMKSSVTQAQGRGRAIGSLKIGRSNFGVIFELGNFINNKLTHSIHLQK